MLTTYQVKYSVKTTTDKSGEFYEDQQIRHYTTFSSTNDLNEIFTDLFEVHRFDGIVGIEISSVDSIEDLVPELEELIKNDWF